MPFEPLDRTDPESVGPYHLLARLGVGGMGRVYLARSAGGRTVAVKVVRADLAGDADFRERFRREVSAAQSVGGTFTAPVVDADRDGPSPWLATAYVLGPALDDAVRAHGPLPVGAVRTLGVGLAQALAAIHAAGLVHRDLKPSNVLLAADGPRVIDFGIARALDGDRMTSTGVVVGSPGFMSPEQAAGRRLGPAGDVFSLGSVLVYAATGHGPFDQAEDGGAPSAASLLYRVVHDRPDLSGLPEPLLAAVTACLAKDPGDRPTPAELGALLDEPVAPARAGWLPAALASEIATHAAEVMDLEAPVRPADPRAAAAVPTPTEVTAPAADPGTVRLRATDPAPAPVPAPDGAAALAGHPTALSGHPTAPVAPSRPSRRALLFGGGAVALAGAGGLAAWALGGGKPAPAPRPAPPTGTGTTSPSGPSPSPSPTPSRAPGMPPAPLWTYRTEASNVGSVGLAFSPGLLHIGNADLVTVDLTDGRQKWITKDAMAYHLACAGGTVSYGTVADLITVDAATGTVLWKYRSEPPKPNGVQIASDTVLAADDRAVYAMCAYLKLDDKGITDAGAKTEKGIMALSRKDGSMLWNQHRQQTADYTVSSVLTADTLLYTDSKENLVARSLADGTQSWFATTNSRSAYQPEVQDGLVFCSSEPNGIQGVRVSDGKQVWAKPSDRSTRMWYAAPAAGNHVLYTVLGGMTLTYQGTTYTPTAPTRVVAFNAADGTELWHLELPSEVSMDTNPVLVKDTLFVPTADRGIYAVDVVNHKVRWVFQTNAGAELPWHLAGNGELLIAVQGNQVMALPPV
ncbi:MULTISPECIES: serine/threonine-protein kinase [Kitasatospora]|uniref:Putative serine/threonine protein kinase n=1 Tax=Kitasatospora setae (strain ATCC 33774 / DSM 43861 / JCM 3304 / KCC A-0304 / NBRC 14216 / KM-6054) TaxID=452652 RepID=E4NAR2_KITSK|nr:MULTISPECIES: serine/threonine-protein kinase [Kitasatospora]BAJ28293.1 putative serine/threonine protein kinase [Kitasatospora setae KM-6054]